MTELRVLIVGAGAAEALARAVAEAAACLGRRAAVETVGGDTHETEHVAERAAGLDVVVAPAGPLVARLTLALSHPEAFVPVVAVARTVAEGVAAAREGGAADFVVADPARGDVPEMGSLVSAMLVAENRRVAVEAFRVQRAALAATLAAAGAAVAVADAEGVVETFAAAPSLRDVLPSAFAGRPLARLIGEDSEAGDGEPGDGEPGGGALALAARGEPVRLERAVADGQRTLRWTLGPLLDGLAAVAVETTDAARAARQTDLLGRFLDGVARETRVVLFATDSVGRFVYLRGHGFEEAEGIVGETVDVAFGEVPQVVANVYRALGGETFTDRVRLPDGRRFRVFYAPIDVAPGERPGMLGVATDTTQGDALARKASLLEALVAQTGALAAAAGPTGEALAVSPALADLLGADAPAIAARGGIATVYTEPGVAARIAAAVRGGQPWSGPLALRARDGRSVPARARARPVFDADGERLGAVVVFEPQAEPG